MKKLERVLLTLMMLAGLCWIRMIALIFDDARVAVRASDAPSLHFTVGDGVIDVRELPDMTLIQSVPFRADALTPVIADMFFESPDINFDGYPDLLIPYSRGLQNTYYDGWLWNPDTSQFTFYPPIQRLANPAIDEKHRRIFTFDHGSATDNAKGEYAFIGGALTEIRRVEQTYDASTNLFILKTYERNASGELALTKTETLSEAEIKRRISSP